MGGSAKACRELDANYGATGLASQAAVLQAATAVNLRLPAPAAPHLLLGMKQKAITVIAKAFAGDISTCKALKDLARAPLNDAEKSLQAVVKRWRLNIDVPLTYVDVGNDCRIPMLLPADYIRTLRDAGYLNKLLDGSLSTSPTHLFGKFSWV